MYAYLKATGASPGTAAAAAARAMRDALTNALGVAGKSSPA
jgi:hypothetical protein